MKKIFPVLGIIFLVIIAFYNYQRNNFLFSPFVFNNEQPQSIIEQTVEPSPSPSPTPKPLTFAEMNAKYGPCVYLPVLMYHHVQSKDNAELKKQTGFSVYTDIFEEQIRYLKEKGYETVAPIDILNFFNTSAPLPKKSILLTFDDAYSDFYSDALPILSKYGYRSVVFTPTGLVNNFSYMNWQEIMDASSRGVYFANHTWSHKSSKESETVIENEIITAQNQLQEKNLNSDMIIAYPYGPSSTNSLKVLQKLNFKMAFTTNPGSVLCSKMRFDLPRLRIGNKSMSYYGL